MAHFARIENETVVEVIVIANAVLLDKNGQEQESIGATFCHDTLGGGWVQTSYSAKFKSKFACPGDTWDGTNFTREESATDVV